MRATDDCSSSRSPSPARDRGTEFQTTMQLVQVQKVATDDAGLRAVFGSASTRTPRSEAGRHVHELLPLLRCSFAFPPVMGCRRHCATLFQGALGERQRAVTGKGRLPYSCTFSFQYVLRTLPESDFLVDVVVGTFHAHISASATDSTASSSIHTLQRGSTAERLGKPARQTSI